VSTTTHPPTAADLNAVPGGGGGGFTVDVVTVTTARGLTADVVRRQSTGGHSAKSPVVFFHGPLGLLADEPLLDALARTRTVLAPVWPGYGSHETEHLLEDMGDFTLHGWDLVDALRDAGAFGAAPPVLAGHSMGAMVAAEMACVAPSLAAALVLLAPLGLWDDASPIPDLFATMPYDFAPLLFHDHERGTRALIGDTDWNDPVAIEAFLVANARRLGTAGKVLFPVPNRRLSKRLYRCQTRTLLAWGAEDRFVPEEPYASHWQAALPHAARTTLSSAGHFLHCEQPEALATSIATFLDG
jgi:pimeloyl-ACP methyl ester carboxylesterase